MAEKELEFFARRLAEEERAARSADPNECIHRKLADEYAAVIAAYRKGQTLP